MEAFHSTRVQDFSLPRYRVNRRKRFEDEKERKGGGGDLPRRRLRLLFHIPSRRMAKKEKLLIHALFGREVELEIFFPPLFALLDQFRYASFLPFQPGKEGRRGRKTFLPKSHVRRTPKNVEKKLSLGEV